MVPIQMSRRVHVIQNYDDTIQHKCETLFTLYFDLYLLSC